MIIYHNMKADNAHRMLGINQSGLAKNVEKLSSGLRVNRAADDAAGLYISEKMRSQVRGLDQASRNALDGISAVQTAEGALDEVHSMLQRMRELSVQAANDPNQKEDRQAIQAEIDELITEIDSISVKTEFNKQKLLNGEFKGKMLQVGANKNQALEMNIESMSAASLGITKGGPAGDKDALELEKAITGMKLANAVKDLTGEDKTGEDDPGTEAKGVDLSKEGGLNKELKDATNSVDEYEDPAKIDHTGTGSVAEKYKAVYGDDGQTGSRKDYADALAKGGDPEAIEKAKIKYEKDLAAYQDEVSKANTTRGKIKAKKAEIEKLKTSFDELTEAVKNAGTGAGGGLSVLSHRASNNAISTIDSAISKVSKQRSNLGAVQNRLEHTIKNLDNAAENTQAAESRIRDIDMAKEMSTFTRNNILTQASQAMLAQANQLPQQVLQLLR